MSGRGRGRGRGSQIKSNISKNSKNDSDGSRNCNSISGDRANNGRDNNGDSNNNYATKSKYASKSVSAGVKYVRNAQNARNVRANAADINLLEVFPPYLVIVESPSKCAKIEEYLNDMGVGLGGVGSKKYMCVATRGHLREITGLSSVNLVGDGAIRFTVMRDKLAHCDYLRAVIRKFLPKNVYLATDCDREGEAIAWHVCDMFGLNVATTARIMFSEITRDAICAAILSPRVVDMTLVRQQWARQVLDMIVGFRVSPMLWKYIYSSRDAPLSAGRCQTPALRLIYENQREIDARVMHTRFKVIAQFMGCDSVAGLDFVMQQKNIRDIRDDGEDGHTCVEPDIVRVLENLRDGDGGGRLTMSAARFVERSNKGALNTSRLLQIGCSVLRMSPKQIMSYAQTLYQDGHITYMRTDSTKYSAGFLQKINSFVVGRWGARFLLAGIGAGGGEEITSVLSPALAGVLPPTGARGVVGGQPPPTHECIRVTDLDTGGVVRYSDTRIGALYRFIWRMTLQSCMSNSVYRVADLNVACLAASGAEYGFVHTLEERTFAGWEIVGDGGDDNATKKNTALYFETILGGGGGVPVKLSTIVATMTVENKQSHFTEAGLIKRLDELGIGRPSTFAMLVETIQTRGYTTKKDFEGYVVECRDYRLDFGSGGDVLFECTSSTRVFGKESGKLIITPLGVLAIEFLLKVFDALFSYDYTNKMEELLLTVGGDGDGGDGGWVQVCVDCAAEIKRQLTAFGGAKMVKKFAIDLGDGYDFVFQRYGPVIRHVEGGGDGGGGGNESDDAANKYTYIPLRKDFIVDLEKIIAKKYVLADFIGGGGGGVSAMIGDDDSSDTGDGGGSHLQTISYADHNARILRALNDELSIRKSKFGAYIYYKTSTMKMPKFFKIAGLNGAVVSAENNITSACRGRGGRGGGGRGGGRGAGSWWMSCDAGELIEMIQQKYLAAAAAMT